MTDEELKTASGVNAEIGSYGFDLFKEGVAFGRKKLDDETIRKILSLYDNSFKGFREDVKKKCIQCIKLCLDDD